MALSCFVVDFIGILSGISIFFQKVQCGAAIIPDRHVICMSSLTHVEVAETTRRALVCGSPRGVDAASLASRCLHASVPLCVTGECDPHRGTLLRRHLCGLVHLPPVGLPEDVVSADIMPRRLTVPALIRAGGAI